MPIVDLRGREAAPALIQLLATAQIHRAPEDALERAPSIAREYATNPNLRLFGYQDAGVLVGLAGIEHQGPGRAILRDLAVLDGHRREGIGRLLVDYLRGPGRFTAVQGDTLASSVAFYERCGFDVRPDGAMRNGETRYHFSCPHQ